MQLPPERDLPNADAMLAGILSSPPAEKPRSRRWLAPVAVAAVIALVAAVLGIRAMTGSGRDGVPAVQPSTSRSSLPRTSSVETTTAPPSTSTSRPSSQPPASPTSTAPPTSEPAQSALGPQTFTFRYFTVSYGDTNQQPTRIEGVDGFFVKVCARELPEDNKAAGTVPVTRGAWKLEPFPNASARTPLTSGGYSPAYPASANLKVGECASGWLSFTAPTEAIDGYNLVYENGVGERAVWNIH